MHPKLLTCSALLFSLAIVRPAFAQTIIPDGVQTGTTNADDAALIRRLADTILTDGRTYGNLKVLTKTVGQRLSGSAGYYKAEKWGQQALTEALADKVTLQECMVPHWVRGGR